MRTVKLLLVALLGLAWSGLTLGQAGGNAYVPTIPTNVTSPANNQCLVYQSSSQKWVNGSCSSGGGATVTGSPANGNLTFFSGAGTISNGNLSGDCTTSGTGVLTCQLSNLSSLPSIPDGTLLGNSSGGTAAPSAIASGITKVFDVRAYGAKCDGTTDDHAAWQSAINAAAALTPVSTTPLSAKIFGCGSGQSVITTTLNFTAFNGSPYAGALTVDMSGTCLIGKTAGTPVIDALGSRYIQWDHLCITGSATSTPNIGIQIGRTGNNISADLHYFNRPVVVGNYTFASVYNLASETVTFDDAYWENKQSTGTPYVYVADGYNHFNATSAFVTVTTPTETAQSFNEDTFIGGSFWGVNGAADMWLGNVTRHRFIGIYGATTAANAIVLYYASGGGAITSLLMDGHFETNAITDDFLITGTQATPVIYGLTFTDHLVNATNSVFKLGGSATSATMQNADIQIPQFVSGNSVKLFDSASAWTAAGRIQLPAAANWTPPASFAGTVCLTTVCSFGQYGTKSIQANITDSTAVGGNARGANAVDWQTLRNAAGQVASGLASTVGGGEFNLSTNTGSTVAGGQANTSSGIYSTAAGNGNLAQGAYSLALGNSNWATGVGGAVSGGQFAWDRGRYGSSCFASGEFATIGDAQQCISVLRISTTGAAAVRLTADGLTASAINCINIPNNTAFGLTIDVVAFDHTTVTKSASWNGWTGLITRGANAASTSLSMNTTPTPITNGSFSPTIAATADTSNGCLNISVTPPGGNTDTLNIVARAQTVEVQ